MKTERQQDGPKETSFAQVGKDKTCYCCGKKGHISPKCPQKTTIKKEDWAFCKATVCMQADGKEDHQDDDSTGNAACGYNYQRLIQDWMECPAN
jgi:hypothetical protein